MHWRANMSIDLSSVQSKSEDGEFRLGLDKDKVAALLDQMADNIRAGAILPKQVELTSIFLSDEWEQGRMVFQFHEKVIP